MKSTIKKYTSTLGGVLISLGITSVVGLILLLFYFYVYLPSATNHGETITVPSVEGLNISELEDFLVKRNLRYEVNDSSYTDDYPPLTVLRQFPAAGAKVKENRVIYISINRVTPPTVPLPNLVDGSLINAEAVLRGNELKRGRIQLVRGPFLNLVKEMRFEGEKIAPGTRIPKGSIIDLLVEDGGSNTVPAPDVRGYTLEDAKIPIFGSNLNLGEIHVVGDTTGREAIVVLKQKPPAYQNIKVGDVVELWVGKKGTPVPEEEEEELDEIDNQD
ncbi:MAG: PASTA domain-containing protein [Cyclobacteriaceae bacterium]|nr:PASTA domain-containing protein [Cyclobacteriaceae bacterium]MBX2955348.1 PASTA domain-containing protein [Cyclobacteriaceae bacterium]